MKSFQEFNEEQKVVTSKQADAFIADVLKLGSKDNLFDKFLKKEGYSPDEVSTLMSIVVDRIREKWLM